MKYFFKDMALGYDLYISSHYRGTFNAEAKHYIERNFASLPLPALTSYLGEKSCVHQLKAAGFVVTKPSGGDPQMWCIIVAGGKEYRCSSAGLSTMLYALTNTGNRVMNSAATAAPDFDYKDQIKSDLAAKIKSLVMYKITVEIDGKQVPVASLKFSLPVSVTTTTYEAL